MRKLCLEIINAIEKDLFPYFLDYFQVIEVLLDLGDVENAERLLSLIEGWDE